MKNRRMGWKPMGQGRAVVTVLSKQHGEMPASISPQNVSIKVNGKPAIVTSWASLRGPDSRLEMVILIDSSARNSLGSQFSDFEHFISSLPPNVKAGITSRCCARFTCPEARRARAPARTSASPTLPRTGHPRIEGRGARW